MSGREFELATGNLIMGRFTWLYICVPEGWTVKLGDYPSDINYTTVVNDSGWVTDGASSYYVVNLVNGDVLELEIRCRKGVKERASSLHGYELVRVNGHEACLSLKTIKRGLRRNLLHQAVIHIPCVNTSRTIELTLTAKSMSEIDEMKKYLPNYRCH
ncbi:MAG: hypothetical protein QXM16_08285 [Nitrososphaerota archaeon]